MTHFWHSANDPEFSPLFGRGDSRVTFWRMERGEHYEAKDVYWRRLEAEGPAAAHKLMTLSIPPQECRMRIPVVETEEKREQAEAQRNEVVRFTEVRPDWLWMDGSELLHTFHEFVGPRTAKLFPISLLEMKLLKHKHYRARAVGLQLRGMQGFRGTVAELTLELTGSAQKGDQIKLGRTLAVLEDADPSRLSRPYSKSGQKLVEVG